MSKRVAYYGLFFFFFSVSLNKVSAQCTSADIMEPGFAFLTSSRGCAPFTVDLETIYLQSTPGTAYYVDWGDGTPEEIYVQGAFPATGVTISHTYPNSPVDCGYDLVIDADNICNPRGSVVPIQTQVIVWTNDVTNINPGEFRVCQGFATSLQFVDNSDWNCFPRATRENNDPRWIQWIYGTGPAGARIPGIQVNALTPGAYPYNDPNPSNNPLYPVLAPGQTTLPIDVPATVPADVGRQFEITLNNWNQCNAYDNDLTDGNALNPVSGDLVNGDNPAMTTTARIVIVESPNPSYQTWLNSIGGILTTIFCIDDIIYFENLTPAIGGANFQYTWEFYDNNTGAGLPISTSTDANPTFSYSTSGVKLIRLLVRDSNAAGNCEEIYENFVNISPTLVAAVGTTDLSGVIINPEFCQDDVLSQSFDVRFVDNSVGVPTVNTRWRWEFFDESGALIFEEPAAGTFSATALGPFDRNFVTPGIYRAVLTIMDVSTTCESIAEEFVYVYPAPQANFSASRECIGQPTSFADLSSIVAIDGETVIRWEWDLDYDGITFNSNPTYLDQTSFDFTYATSGTFDVALLVTTDKNSCTDLFIQTVTVDPLPLAQITPDVTEGCSVLTVNFSNDMVGSQPDIIDQYIWEIDNGMGFQIDSIQSPSDPGFSSVFPISFVNTTSADLFFDVRMRVISINGCVSISGAQTIRVFPEPLAGFNSINYSPFDDNCSPVDVDFEVDALTQSQMPTGYVWTIDDINGLVTQVNTGTTPNFSFSFDNSTQEIKDYSITLSSSLGGVCTGDSTVTIRVNPVPSSPFVLDTLSVSCDDVTIRTEAIQKGLSLYNWQVTVNGVILLTTGSSQDFLEYTIAKTTIVSNVEIQLITTNFAGCNSNPTIQSIDIEQQKIINASFDATPLNQTLPNATVFLINNTNTGPWDYLWDFDDGTTSLDPNLTEYTYLQAGTYTISLTASSGDCVSTDIKTIVINPIPPIVDFDYDPAFGCSPLQVSFTNLSQFALSDSYEWDFGDGSTSSLVNPIHTYFEPGIYSVSLTASNAFNQSTTEIKADIIEVFDTPIAQFDVRPTIVFIPDNPIFTNNASIGATSFLWDFGDGTTSTESEPTHQYTEEGFYDVTLIAYNNLGCTDTLKRVGLVEGQQNGRLLVPNAFSPSLAGPSGGFDGAGVNDVFLPLTQGVSEFELFIFNRWGELLFKSSDRNIGWDGYYNGKLAPQDVYVYKLNLVFENGQQTTRTGDVNLIR